jgi:hypothetical protein
MPSLAKMQIEDSVSCGAERLAGGGRVSERQGRKRLHSRPDVSLVSIQALNNLQSTFSGFGYINSENVFKVPGRGEG